MMAKGDMPAPMELDGMPGLMGGKPEPMGD
jgi:hypothetical protein